LQKYFEHIVDQKRNQNDIFEAVESKLREFIHHSIFCRLYHFMGNLPKKKILLKGHYEVIQRNVQQSVRSTSRFGKVATTKASLITYYYF